MMTLEDSAELIGIKACECYKVTIYLYDPLSGSIAHF